MIQLYAAVGRYHIEVQPNGKKIPIVKEKQRNLALIQILLKILCSEWKGET